MRSTNDVTIASEGRDKGKVFVITEMAAGPAERWAMRALLALAKGGIEIPEDVKNTGWAGVLAVGYGKIGSLDPDLSWDLMEELMACIQIKPSPNVTRALVEDDIQEVATRLLLKAEVFALHVGFTLAEIMSQLTSAMMTSADSSNTKTSQG